jgi:hypothetical protein
MAREVLRESLLKKKDKAGLVVGGRVAKRKDKKKKSVSVDSNPPPPRKSPSSESSDRKSRKKEWSSEDFVRRAHIGTGGFSKVYLAKESSPESPQADLVLKIMNHEQLKGLNTNPTDVLAEYDIHKRIRHVNITRVIGFFKTSLESTLVLEYCDKGDLHDYIYAKENSFRRSPFR